MNSEFYDQARRDAVAVCGFSNLQQLTPAQSVKVDLVLSLRLAIDELQSRLVAGVEKVDVNRLIGACDALVQLLPAGQENLTPARSDDDDDTLQKLEEILASIRQANAFEEAREIDVLRVEVERITHENERLRAAAAQPAPAPARFGSKADIGSTCQDVRFVPKADMRCSPSETTQAPWGCQRREPAGRDVK